MHTTANKEHTMNPTTLTGLTFRADVYASWAKISVALPGRHASSGEAQAQAAPYAALFPKAAKVQASTLNTFDDNGRYYAGYLVANARLAADGVNGGRNETGCRRLAQVLRTVQRLGGTVEYSGYSAAQVGQLLRGETVAA
jgi:hypothetical protein